MPSMQYFYIPLLLLLMHCCAVQSQRGCDSKRSLRRAQLTVQRAMCSSFTTFFSNCRETELYSFFQCIRMYFRSALPQCQSIPDAPALTPEPPTYVYNDNRRDCWYLCTCSDPFNDCPTVSPCVHGTCQDTYQAYSCQCDHGWTGQLCDEETSATAATTPAATTPAATTPAATTPAATTPAATTPAARTPAATTPAATTPAATTPAATTPAATTPAATTPAATTPAATTPAATTPAATTPAATTPAATTPAATTPAATTPAATTPAATIPDATTPAATTPETTPADTTAADTTAADTTAADTTAADTTAADTTAADTTAADTTAADTTAADTTAADTTAADSTAADTTAADTTAADTTAADSTAADTTAADTTAADTTAADTTAADTTAADTTAADTTAADTTAADTTAADTTVADTTAADTTAADTTAADTTAADTTAADTTVADTTAADTTAADTTAADTTAADTTAADTTAADTTAADTTAAETTAADTTAADTTAANSAACELSPAVQQAMLDRHNELRSQVALGNEGNQPSASNMKILEWYDPLATYAEDWAVELATTDCILSHGDPATRDTVDGVRPGENGCKLPGTTTCDESELIAHGIVCIDLWYAEVTETTEWVFQGVQSSYPDGVVRGHYTAVVWAESDQVGCGLAQCPGGGIQFFCNYLPPGNTIGQTPYEAGTPCSACWPGATCDAAVGLCSGGTNPAFNQCIQPHADAVALWTTLTATEKTNIMVSACANAFYNCGDGTYKFGSWFKLGLSGSTYFINELGASTTCGCEYTPDTCANTAPPTG